MMLSGQFYLIASGILLSVNGYQKIWEHSPEERLPICQPYKGTTCDLLLRNVMVFVPPDATIEILEERLKAAYGVIKESKDMNPNCRDYALPSLCYSTLPVCQSPEYTNHQYFAGLASLTQPPSEGRPIIEYEPPTRNSLGSALRRICRTDCELLENELCQREYAIAKRHPTIGQKLPLEECVDLPAHLTDCSALGIKIDVDGYAHCYWGNGDDYRGMVARTSTGVMCQRWARYFKDIANYPQLIGHSYCRNPGMLAEEPSCLVADGVMMPCGIQKCSTRSWFYICMVFVMLAFVMVTIAGGLFYQRYKKRNSMVNIQNVNLPTVDKNIYGNSRLNSPIEMTSLLTNHTHHFQPSNGQVVDASGPIPSTTVLRVPQYTLADVRCVEELGEGAFGKVYKAELTQPDGEKIFVAVKALKENASAKTQTDFRREIDLISDLRHENIVCILGVVLKEEPLCMLFEYMTQGDLHEFLIANSPNESKQLSNVQFLQISMQIADGMDYLAGHHYVHRDLAARNCLVGEQLTVKISDFGLSRDIYSSDYYRVQSKSLLPVRWMPSESILYGKFTTESDVWSFGVVLWEIYSYGLQPYYGYNNQEVINMVRTRQLLPCPDSCPSAIYSLMIECWHEQAVRRPSFAEIGHRLKIWHQAQKRNEDGASMGSTRKSSITFSQTGRIPYSVTPSSSNQQLAGRDSIDRRSDRYDLHSTETLNRTDTQAYHSLDRDGARRPPQSRVSARSKQNGDDRRSSMSKSNRQMGSNLSCASHNSNRKSVDNLEDGREK